MRASMGTIRLLQTVAIVAALAMGSLAPAHADETDATRTRIAYLIGSAECRHDQHCATLAIGLNTCGGPAEFLAWSQWATDRQMLLDAVKAAEARRGRLAGPGLGASICRPLADPGARCEKPAGALVGNCRLKSQSSQVAGALPDR